MPHTTYVVKLTGCHDEAETQALTASRQLMARGSTGLRLPAGAGEIIPEDADRRKGTWPIWVSMNHCHPSTLPDRNIPRPEDLGKAAGAYERWVTTSQWHQPTKGSTHRGIDCQEPASGCAGPMGYGGSMALCWQVTARETLWVTRHHWRLNRSDRKPS